MIVFLLLLVLAVVIVLALAAKQPDQFSVSRTGSINASAEVIFQHINNLHNWDAWSPWAKLDLNAKNSFEGPNEGIGAKTSWSGNNKVGTGSMTVTESRPHDYIQFKLEFLKPMQATNTAEFSLKQNGDRTTVTWTMSGANSFMGKIMSVFMNCEKMVGGQFEQGLVSLKNVVESKR
ncbi:MAG: SRPBCC family protein [Gammaproteobacteria bacterium]|nr:SRPBCC family protein [Gammaproteobacteria bacterium]